ncbi:lysM and putative peptidoglycan-binding domain-containing protein 1 [Drosophila grimshawi]|uniref:lysM and putative peptidoglycan-binding domain-containing protein 1 n=1 Tax=Drosophila grimshawi TaxID=7222 RepID=UPI000C8711D0|nr:lysM and putative peptidoglycan-binding domain-containing protein 1 [Drosophila grimshawi]
MATEEKPNLCGPRLGGSEFWVVHQVSNGETMAHLALKYDTTIGQICRANRMHWQDILQMRRHIWLPVTVGRQQAPVETKDQLHKRAQSG